MYEKFVNEAKDTFKPMFDLVDINTKAMEKLVSQQAAYVVDLLKFNLEHTRALSESKDLESALEAQKAYAKDVSQKFADAAKQNFNVLLETKDAVSEVFESSLKNVKAKAAVAAKKAA